MSPEHPRPGRYLRIQPEPDAGPVTLRGKETPQHRSTEHRSTAPKTTAPKTTADDSFVFTESVVRAGWSMRLHALIGDEVARAVAADILTVAEAEVLLTRLAVVIDQAVGADEH